MLAFFKKSKDPKLLVFPLCFGPLEKMFCPNWTQRTTSKDFGMTHHTFKKLFLFSLLQVFFSKQKSRWRIFHNKMQRMQQLRAKNILIPSKIFSLFLSSELPVHEIDLEMCIPASNHKTIHRILLGIWHWQRHYLILIETGEKTRI